MLIKVKGQVSAFGQKKSGVSQSSGNPWVVQEVLIRDEKDVTLCVTVFGEDNIAKFKIGQNVEFSAVLSSKEWNGKYFISLRYLPPKEEHPSAVQTQYVQQPKTVAQTSNNSDSDSFPF